MQGRVKVGQMVFIGLLCLALFWGQDEYS
jgi:ABC-type multidrug transport system permease subunit